MKPSRPSRREHKENDVALLDKLNQDLKEAMKGGDKVRLETVRLLRGQLQDFQINKQHAPSFEEEMEILQSAAKKRRLTPTISIVCRA